MPLLSFFLLSFFLSFSVFLSFSYISGDKKAAECDWILAAQYSSPEFDDSLTPAEQRIIQSKIYTVQGNYEKVHLMTFVFTLLSSLLVLVFVIGLGQSDYNNTLLIDVAALWQALEEANAAIALDETNADAYHQRGFVESFTGDTQGISF